MAKIAARRGGMILRPALAMLAVLLVTAPVLSHASTGKDLQPIETPAGAPGQALAVIYSGDGGWGALDRGVAKVLAADGLPVLGVDSLRYFLTRRSPQSAAADLAGEVRRHEAAWGRRKLVLVGYSFGADALPAIVPALPADVRDQIRAVVLVGTGPTGDLAFHPASWLNRPATDSFAVAPTIAALNGFPITCIYGAKEKLDICPGLPSSRVRKVELAGGHHFDGDYRTLGQAIYAASEP
jgi:type IV secretory pathway VirJ component